MKTIKKASLLFASLALVLGAGLVGNSDTKEVKAEENLLATFSLGSDNTDSPAHDDGTSEASYSESSNGYNLSITSGTNMFINATDAKGNGCIKLGTSKKVGSFSFAVPDTVSKVVIYAAGYKAKTGALKVNNIQNNLTTDYKSDEGKYLSINVDTSSTKTVSVASVKNSDSRAMINTIEFYNVTTAVESTDEIIKLIDAIGNVEYSDECKAKIDAARNAYDNASSDLQSKVTNYGTLTAAEAKYNELKYNDDCAKAGAVEELINKLPNAEDLTDHSLNDKIYEAYNAYNKLTDEQKDLIVAEGTKIKALIEKLKELPLTIKELLENSADETNEYTFEGIVTNIQGTHFYVQNGDYAILVYTFKKTEGLSIGKKAKITSKLKNFNGLIESVDQTSIELFDSETKISPKEVTTISELNALNQSVLFSLKGLTMGTVSKETKSTRTYSTVKLNDESIMLNVDSKVATTELYNKLKSYENMTFDVVGANVGYFNGTQIAITSLDQIVVHAEQFVADWAKLRANGGKDGICYYLASEHRAEMQTMLDRYAELSKNSANKAYIDSAEDGGTTIANTIEYVSALLAKLDNKSSTGESGVVITSNNSYDKTSLIALFAILGIVTISGYYIIEKKKFSK